MTIILDVTVLLTTSGCKIVMKSIDFLNHRTKEKKIEKTRHSHFHEFCELFRFANIACPKMSEITALNFCNLQQFHTTKPEKINTGKPVMKYPHRFYKRHYFKE